MNRQMCSASLWSGISCYVSIRWMSFSQDNARMNHRKAELISGNIILLAQFYVHPVFLALSFFSFPHLWICEMHKRCIFCVAATKVTHFYTEASRSSSSTLRLRGTGCGRGPHDSIQGCRWRLFSSHTHSASHWLSSISRDRGKTG